MSFSDDKKKISPSPRGSLKDYELAFAVAPSRRDRDRVVDKLADYVLDKACLFEFRLPLDSLYKTAADHAENCLDISDAGSIPPRKVKNWIGDCLKCFDCIVVVFAQEVLAISIPPTSGVAKKEDIKERQVYNALKNEGSIAAAVVGSSMHSIYDHRSNMEHVQIVLKGKRDLAYIRPQRKQGILKACLGHFKTVLENCLPGFRARFPGSDLHKSGSP